MLDQEKSIEELTRLSSNLQVLLDNEVLWMSRP